MPPSISDTDLAVLTSLLNHPDPAKARIPSSMSAAQQYVEADHIPEEGTIDIRIQPHERQSLEGEYKIAFDMFRTLNSQVWYTFSIITTVAVAGLAFFAQLKAVASRNDTWIMSVPIGTGMIIILIGWLSLVRRWWAYAEVDLHRMREIESILGMYLIRESRWVRDRLSTHQQQALNADERIVYRTLITAFPNFPRFGVRQEMLITIIVIALIIIWLLLMVYDFLHYI